MNPKRLTMTVVGLLFLLGAWRSAGAFVVAKSIAPPNASTLQILKTTLHPTIQMATPHRSLITEIKSRLVPTVYACTTNCDGSLAKPGCGPTCVTPLCHCPGCQLSGCTPTWCTTGVAGRKSVCIYAVVNDKYHPNCNSCEADHTTTNCVGN
jgi:hypothetical protein